MIMNLWYARDVLNQIGQSINFNRGQIPNEVTDYYLQRVGFECEDVRL